MAKPNFMSDLVQLHTPTVPLAAYFFESGRICSYPVLALAVLRQRPVSSTEKETRGCEHRVEPLVAIYGELGTVSQHECQFSQVYLGTFPPGTPDETVKHSRHYSAAVKHAAER